MELGGRFRLETLSVVPKKGNYTRTRIRTRTYKHNSKETTIVLYSPSIFFLA